VAADIEAETARIARRYGLSNEQAEKVRVILDEHAKKAEQIARQQLTPDEAARRLKSLKDESPPSRKASGKPTKATAVVSRAGMATDGPAQRQRKWKRSWQRQRDESAEGSPTVAIWHLVDRARVRRR